MGSAHGPFLLGGLAAIAVAAHARSGDTEALLARGACGAAAKSAQRELKAVTMQGDSAVADALARNVRVALECRRPDTPGLGEWLERELALRAKLAGADSADVARVRLERVRRAMQRNQLDEAGAEIAALETQNPTAHWPADVAARVADARSSLHNLRAEARPAFDAATHAIALAREAGDADTLSHALVNQGFALLRQRRGADALAPLAEADRVAREHHGEKAIARVEPLRMMGQAARDAGNPGAAIDALEQSLAILRAQDEPDDGRIANVTLNLAQTLKVSGDLDRAAVCYEQALAADARAPDPAHRLRPAILHGLANLYRERNEHERAVKLYAEAIPLFADAFGAESPQLAQALNNYANAEAILGHYAQAVAMYRRALAIAQARKSQDPADYLPLANIAMIDVWQGRYAEAEAGFHATIEHVRGTAAGSEASTLFAQIGLSASLWGQRRLDEACDAAVAAEQTRQAALRLAASRLGERQSIHLQEYLLPSLDFALAIAADSGQPKQLERAWQLAMSARDQVTSITAQRLAAARTSGDPALAPAWASWREASAAFALAELAPGKDAAGLRDARENLDRAERALAAATSWAAVVTPAPGTFADLRKALPADTSLVLFSPVQPRAPEDFSSPAAETRAPDIHAWILPSGDGAVRAVNLGAADALAGRVDAWTASASDPHVALAEVRRRGEALREAVWTPLAHAIAGRRVLVVPAGPLHRVAWAALPDGEGFLVDAGYRFHVLNHERELFAPERPERHTERLFAVADPALPASTTALTRACRGTRLPALPGARREAEQIGALWRQRFGADAAVTILEGAAANEARVRTDAGNADVLHFATHGVELGSGCTNPPLAERSFSLATDAPLGDDTAPGATAALMLAPGGNQSDDGVLTAQEIAALDLSRTRLAVLAACTTAAGASHHYEGLFGLARAFRLAGVRTIVTSLWPVEDAATAEWSEALYSALLRDGLGIADALWTSQREVLARRRANGASTHPYYWAAFVATGDWR
jgi:CHAT domain-containing protein/tetratricopeptide (TPR) repeat protein